MLYLQAQQFGKGWQFLLQQGIASKLKIPCLESAHSKSASMMFLVWRILAMVSLYWSKFACYQNRTKGNLNSKYIADFVVTLVIKTP